VSITRHTSDEVGTRAKGTLGALLYAETTETPVAEKDWLRLVQYIAAGDPCALHQLYARLHRIVFTLLVRITHSRETAEQVTVDVFHDVWRRAPGYDPAAGTVIGWVMNQARLRAMRSVRLEQREKPSDSYALAAGDTDADDLLSPSTALWDRLAARVTTGTRPRPGIAAPQPLRETEWQEVAPGISCKVLATDNGRERVSMLVRLAPGIAYPPHRHAGVEELHLLEGELWIEDRLLHAGDYNRADPGTADERVFSETGCMCVLVTSPNDEIA
jgi:DNA-directed RNA polymerase specialized sigma24 family protein